MFGGSLDIPNAPEEEIRIITEELEGGAKAMFGFYDY
jgi:hypothetical protein